MRVAITGGRGFIGNILMHGLSGREISCCSLDQYDGYLFHLLNHRLFMPLQAHELSGLRKIASCRLRRIQKRVFRVMENYGWLHETGFNITNGYKSLEKAFRGYDAIIHLAAIPHPDVSGKTEDDFRKLNYEAAVSVFEAAVKAGVSRFVFASSGQVYNINKNRCWKRFPIREEDADAYQESPEFHIYGRLKWKFENYLHERSGAADMVSLALRLEFPGIWGASSANVYNQISVENLVQAFYKSLTVRVMPGAYTLNIADDRLPACLGNPAERLRELWPEVPCALEEYQTSFCLDRAREVIGYQPEVGGSYYHPGAAF